MRYFFHIGYRGTHYRGWQRQPNAPNVQAIIEQALGQIFKREIVITGCGRTDAGVHASQFFFHVDIQQTWDFDLLFRLNKVLPDDIAVFDILPMEGEPHARYDAISRTYDYYIHTCKDPFLSEYSSLYLERNLNVEKMSDAASLLLRYTDFSNFCKSPASHNTTVCKISQADLLTDGSGRIRFTISSNRFLMKMVRIIVGRLLLVGRSILSVEEFEKMLAAPRTTDDLDAAHPQGLHLVKVVYPFLELPSQNRFAMAGSEIAWQQI